MWRHAPPENFGNLDTLRTFLILVFGTNFNTAYNENHHGKYNNIHKLPIIDRAKLSKKRVSIIGII